MSADPTVLPDILSDGLKVVFCGSAAGTKSAAKGAYYAGPGNRFWETIYRVGLTPRLLAPHEFATLRDYGIGLTDMAKSEFGPDSGLSALAYDPAGFRAKILRYEPAAVAFNGKGAGRAWSRDAALGYGRQSEGIGDSAVFVLPSTSGMARRYWEESYWWELAGFVA